MKNSTDLIQKYLNNSISDEEIFQLSSLLKENDDLKLEFQKQVKEHYLIDLWQLNNNKDVRLQRIRAKKLFGRKKVKQRSFNFFKYAAALVIGLSAFSVWKYQSGTKTESALQNVVLKLGDGTTKIIEENSNDFITDSHGNQIIQLQNNQLNYSANTQNSSGTIVYNELLVPNGKRINIRLSDNTLVYLNSGSKFRYPVNFNNAAERKVHIEGEAYFEVSKDKAHPFIVNTSTVAVEVLGTHFNVRAYKKDGNIKTTLAEGKVQVSLNNNSENKVILVPGEAATWTQHKEVLNVTNVNVENDIAWTQNRLLFSDEPFSIIRQKIERSYGVTIKNTYPELNNIKFYGDFDIKTETIEEVLKAFSMTEYFNYTIDNRIITIKK